MPDTPYSYLYVNHVEKCYFDGQKLIICASLNYSFVQLFHFRYNFHSAVSMKQQKTPFFRQHSTAILGALLHKLPSGYSRHKAESGKSKELNCFTPAPPYSRHLSCSSANPVPVCFAAL